MKIIKLIQTLEEAIGNPESAREYGGAMSGMGGSGGVPGSQRGQTMPSP